jgi:hypothetical protein
MSVTTRGLPAAFQRAKDAIDVTRISQVKEDQAQDGGKESLGEDATGRTRSGIVSALYRSLGSPWISLFEFEGDSGN